MGKAFHQRVRNFDAATARAFLALFRERNALISFLFHSLFRNEREIEQNVIDPLQRTTVQQFRQYIEYYLEQGYEFVGPDKIANGLRPDRKYAAITFDDGYFNNTLALPILEEFGVPAAFFISTDNIRQNRSYWWDVVYREWVARGASSQEAHQRGLAMKHLRTEEIESKLADEFGADAFAPRGDIDRPFSPSELRDFAASPFVHLGNHTATHAILTNYSSDDVRRQIHGAQDALRELTGSVPIAIAYPNGNYNGQIMQICRESGLKVGFTTRQRKSYLPLDPAKRDLLDLGRFYLYGKGPILTQCQTCRSDMQIYGYLRDLYITLARERRTSKNAGDCGAENAAPLQ